MGFQKKTQCLHIHYQSTDWTKYSWASLVNSARKESACNAGNLDLIPGLGRSSGEGKGHPLQYSWASLVT